MSGGGHAWSLSTMSECNNSRKCWIYQSSISWKWVLVFHVPLLMLTHSILLQCGWSGAAAQDMGLRIMLLGIGVKEPGVPGQMVLTN